MTFFPNPLKIEVAKCDRLQEESFKTLYGDFVNFVADAKYSEEDGTPAACRISEPEPSKQSTATRQV
jgi:hypothetical protein